MSLDQILLGGGGVVLVLMTLIQIAPIKINPWSAIGRVFNKDVLNIVKETRKVLEEHIRIDDERDADSHRQRILQFNNELLRDIPHTKEDFTEVLAEIDEYEKYCREHPDYKTTGPSMR